MSLEINREFLTGLRDILGRDLLGTTFLGPNLVSLNRAVVPLFELSFLTKSQKLTSA